MGEIDDAMQLAGVRFGKRAVPPKLNKLKPKRGDGDVRKKIREGAVVKQATVRRAVREMEDGYTFQDELQACAKAQPRYREVNEQMGEVVWRNKELVAMHREKGSVC
jgi:hypothetical protein